MYKDKPIKDNINSIWKGIHECGLKPMFLTSLGINYKEPLEERDQKI